MALFTAKMGHVNCRHGVSCENLENLARGHLFKTLAGFQHGQRAEQPREINLLFEINVRHGYTIAANSGKGSASCRH